MSTDPYNSLLDEMERAAPKTPRVKPGARIEGVDPKLIDFATKRDFTITSGNDSPGVHVRGSRHGQNAAVDLRVWDKQPEEVARAMREARAEGLNVLDETRGRRPHIHLSTGGAIDPYDALLNELETTPPAPAPSFPAGLTKGEVVTPQIPQEPRAVATPLPRPSVSSRALSSEEEEAALNEPKPVAKDVAFTPYAGEDLGHVGRAALNLAGSARSFDNQPSLDAPHPDEVGRPVRLKVPAKGGLPSNYDVLLAAAKEIAPELAQALEGYKRETGRDLWQLNTGELRDRLVRDPRGDYYDIAISPTRSDIEVANAYNRGGLGAAKEVAAKAAKDRDGYADAYRESEAQRKAHVAGEGFADRAAAAGEGLVQDAAQSYLHFGENVSTLAEAISTGIRHGWDSPEYQRLRLSELDTRRAMEAAQGLLQAEANEQGSAAKIVRGLGSGLAQLPKYAMAGPYGAGAVAAIESADRGPRAMISEGAKMNVLNALGELAGGFQSAAARQIAGRAAGGAFMAGGAALEGVRDPRALAEQAVIGAAMSGPRGAHERTIEPVPHVAPVERTARQSYLDMPDVPVTTLERPRLVRREADAAPETTPTPEPQSQSTHSEVEVRRKPQPVLAHIAGPSGAGKTELMNAVGEKVKNFNLIDLDEFDERAETALGWSNVPKSRYTDEMLSKLHVEKQRLLDEYIRQSDKPIVFFGHHIEAENELAFPAERRILLDVSPQTSAINANRRDGKTLKDLKKDVQVGREDVEYLTGRGYEVASPRKVYRELTDLSAASPESVHHSQLQPRDEAGHFDGPPQIPEGVNADVSGAGNGTVLSESGVSPQPPDRLPKEPTQAFVEGRAPEVGASDSTVAEAKSKVAPQPELPGGALQRPVVAAPEVALRPRVAPEHREAVRAGFKNAFRLDDARADGVMDLVDARARAWGKEHGRDASDYYRERFGDFQAGEEGPRVEGTEARGLTRFMSDARAILRGFRRADVSSAAHEFSHVFRRDLHPELLADAESALGVKNGEWTQAHEERFARGFERYLRDGTYPDVRLRRVFESFRNWLTEIYPSIRSKTSPLNSALHPELAKVFDRALGGEPKGEHGQLIHSLHKAPDETTADVRAALTEQVGRPRSSHLSPDDLKAWADAKGLGESARRGLDFGVAQYRETIRKPTAYEQTGIRKRNVDPTTQSLTEFVRASGGIRVDRDRANRGELESLTNKGSGSSGLVRKDGVSVHDMARMAAEAGYPVAEGGGYYTDKGFMERAAGSEEPSADVLIDLLDSEQRGGEKTYSNQREVDYEERYRQENPDDSADALISLIETERGGILFDKVQDGTATKRETEEFRRLALDEYGVFPDHVRDLIRLGKEKKAAGLVPDAAGTEAAGDSARAGRDSDVEFNPGDYETGGETFFQPGQPEQLGFVEQGLTRQSQDRPRPKVSTGATTSPHLDAESSARLSALKDSPVARAASEVERRVNPSNKENAPDVLAALSKLSELKRSKQTVSDYLSQGSLFGDRELSPRQEQILAGLDRNPRKVIEEAFPEAPKPQQDVLFQSGETGRRSPEFERWFKDSKVVDEAGEPLVVYHGTHGDFDAFKTGEGVSDAIFFASKDSLPYVEGYLSHFGGEGQNIRPVYLSLKNPKRIIATDASGFLNYETENQWTKAAKRQGHDGLIITNPDTGETFYAAFKPEQIKSVNNRGTFDPSSPNIVYQSGDTASRRQRAYRALLQAKGQLPLSDDAAAKPRRATLGEQITDLANAPRALKSSIDLSAAGRQGQKFVTSHPVKALKIFFGDQMRALSNKGYEGFVSDLKTNPRFKQMRDAGLYLASTAHGGKITEREEAFASKFAEKVPLVQRSEHAYVAFLDAARSQWFEQLAGLAERKAAEAKRPVSAEQYKAIADFVNKATGRGDLGKGRVAEAAPVLNALLFSPRYMASKIQFFDPRVYARLPEGAKGTAIRQAVQHYGVLVGALALAKAGQNSLGWQVKTDDPTSADFGKIKAGNTRYDLAAGDLSYITLAARLFKHFEEGGKRDETALKLVDRWLRYKYAPIPAAIRNLDEGKDAVGQPTSFKKEALQLVAPMYLKDLYDAWQQEGGKGLAKNAPGFVGLGVQTYSDGPKSGRPAVSIPTPKGPKVSVTSSPMRLEGARESANVEDVRTPDRGEREISTEQAGAIAEIVDTLPEGRAPRFLANLDETRQLGVVGEGVTRAAEWVAAGLGRRDAEKVVRAQRLLARERRLRPAQFEEDALGGLYGDTIREEVEGRYQYPQNSLPRPKVATR
jgi:hypothetical protein